MNIGQWFRRKAERRAEVERLAKSDDTRNVGPLAEAYWSGDRHVRAVAETALLSLLPRLKARDAELLNDEQRRCLNRMLRGGNTQLVIAVLRAYEMVGDASALPHVERLTTALCKTLEERRVREAARECLLFLHERAEQQRAGETLLRSADAPGTPPEILLRASFAPCVPANALRSSAQGKPDKNK